jgi:outer membrane protein OmpA-like peptidoglycan-associated protein
MRCLFLIAIMLLTSALPARAQEGRDAGSVQAALVANGLFRALGVQFETGQATLLPSARPVLDAVAEVLLRHPSLRLEIAGHTDAVGSAAVNLRLSEERALSVKAYLMARHGIGPRRIETVGYGETLPVASNTNPTERALNRRVEFRMLNPTALEEAQTEAAPVVEADTMRRHLQRQVEEAVREALGDAGPDITAVNRAERELELERERVRELEERLARLERALAAETAAAPLVPAVRPRAARSRFALLPFTGFYMRGDLPVVVGIRADVATSLIGSPRFQPELAIAFRPDDRATLFSGNLVFPVSLGGVTPYFGAGVGFHDLDSFQGVLNLLIGADFPVDFGVLFAELTVEDFGDYNRLILGFRQEF